MIAILSRRQTEHFGSVGKPSVRRTVRVSDLVSVESNLIGRSRIVTTTQRGIYQRTEVLTLSSVVLQILEGGLYVGGKCILTYVLRLL